MPVTLSHPTAPTNVALPCPPRCSRVHNPANPTVAKIPVTLVSLVVMPATTATLAVSRHQQPHRKEAEMMRALTTPLAEVTEGRKCQLNIARGSSGQRDQAVNCAAVPPTEKQKKAL